MTDIPSLIRAQLMRVHPGLSVANADALIEDIRQCYVHISEDEQSQHGERQDYFDFSLIQGVALAVIFRESEFEVFAFASDESLIHESRDLATVDVAEFLAIARRKIKAHDTPLRFALADALEWFGASEPVR